MTGRTADGRIETVRIVPDGSPVANYGFDVTPARLVTGLITERGVLKADRAALAAAFPERIAAAAEYRKTVDAECLDRSRRRCGCRPLCQPRPRPGAAGLYHAPAGQRSAAGAAWRRQHVGQDRPCRSQRRRCRGALRQGLRLGHGHDRARRPAGGAADAAAEIARAREAVRRGNGAVAARQSDRSQQRRTRRSRRCCTPSSRTNSSTTPIRPRCWR